jgi:hypothetical protein
MRWRKEACVEKLALPKSAESGNFTFYNAIIRRMPVSWPVLSRVGLLAK